MNQFLHAFISHILPFLPPWQDTRWNTVMPNRMQAIWIYLEAPHLASFSHDCLRFSVCLSGWFLTSEWSRGLELPLAQLCAVPLVHGWAILGLGWMVRVAPLWLFGCGIYQYLFSRMRSKGSRFTLGFGS